MTYLKNHHGARWQNLLAARDPVALARQCKAKSKRTGLRCRNAARKGHKVCGHHGVARSDPKNVTPQAIARRLRSRGLNAIRDEFDRKLREGEFHPDTMREYRSLYASRVRQYEAPGFILALDRHLRGNGTVAEWRRQLRHFVR